MTEIIFIGVLASLLFAEITGWSPGGIVVPAYFALHFHEPRRLAATVALAVICMGTVRLFSGFMILYGRRRFAVFLMTGMVLRVLPGNLLTPFIPALGTLGLAIGLLVPGLLAKDMEGQGILPTLLSLAVVTCLTRLVVVLL